MLWPNGASWKYPEAAVPIPRELQRLTFAKTSHGSDAISVEDVRLLWFFSGIKKV